MKGGSLKNEYRSTVEDREGVDRGWVQIPIEDGLRIPLCPMAKDG